MSGAPSGEGSQVREIVPLTLDTSQLVTAVLGARSVPEVVAIEEPLVVEETAVVAEEPLTEPVTVDTSNLISGILGKINGHKIEPEQPAVTTQPHITDPKVNGNGSNSSILGGGTHGSHAQKPKQSRPKAERKLREDRDPTAFDDDLVRMYLRDIGKHPLLTKEDEVRLAQAIEAGNEARARLDNPDIELSPAERIQARRIARAGEEAKTQFINSNLRLVVSVAKKYQGKGLELLDLIQEGNISLDHAVDKFDWRKGFKFSTYATWWLRQGIARAIANEGATIRLPVHMHDEVKRYMRARATLKAQDIEPNLENLAAEMGVSPRKMESIIEAANMNTPILLDDPLKTGGESDATFGDVTPDPKSQDGFDEAERGVAIESLNKALAELLDERECRIIIERFGLEDGQPKTLEEVGVLFNLTRERIRQIEARAMSKLRHPAASKLFPFRNILG